MPMPLPRFLIILALIIILAGLTIAAAFSANFFGPGKGAIIPGSGVLAALMGLALIARFGTKGR
jgi:hypothetical protein